MKVLALRLNYFRNYTDLNIKFDNNINIFIGKNAQGKTNILEALYYAAMGKSHRTNDDSDVILWNQDACVLEVNFTRHSVENSIKYQISRINKKQIYLNTQQVKKRSPGSFNVVMFSPEDLLIIKGAPVLRRRFIDNEIAQANAPYYHHLQQYNRIIMQRNNLLKKIREHRAEALLLDSWDTQLAQFAEKIVQKRLNAISKLSMLANLMQRKITSNSESLSITYDLQGETAQPTNLTEWYLEQLKKNRDVDVLHGSTSIGPHRDDLVFKVNGINLRNFGSQGQQRTGILAIKLAELEYIKSETGEYPVLLLDDVMSELDQGRRQHLLLFIRDRIQTFITTTEKGLAEIQNAQYYQVDCGSIVR